MKASSMATTGSKHCFVGFDLGTSGARISVIDEELKELFSSSITWKEYDDCEAWVEATYTLLERAPMELRKKVQSICVSGTSASCLLVDKDNYGKVTRRPWMYNYDVVTSTPGDAGARAMSLLNQHAPEKHTARANTSSLAKLLTWHQQSSIDTKKERLAHQSDYISMTLLNFGRTKKCGSAASAISITSDWHNCLKLGYDVQNDKWPEWIKECMTNIEDVLPEKVLSPGQPMGTISTELADRFGLPEDCVLVGGTTDSNAAFFAAAAGSSPAVGTAVTSLGSTLAMKQLSSTYIEDAERGVYSHRFPIFGKTKKSSDDDDDTTNQNEKYWLIGGASNVGCAVLRQEQFSTDELVQLSQQIDPKETSPLDYYPLAVERGERFPVADPQKLPLLTPKPDDRKEYLHGILQGIANVEIQGFQVFQDLGASLPTQIYTCGGGSNNDMWSQMRQHMIQQHFDTDTTIPVSRAANTEASYGAAILASATFTTT